MSHNKKHKKNQRTKQSLMIAIGAVATLLVVLIVLMVILMLNKPDDGAEGIQSTMSAESENPTNPAQSGTNLDTQPTGDTQPSDPQPQTGNIPTETNPIVLEQGLYIVHMGNFTGRYVEDGSDAQVENFCAAIVENRSEKTLQLLQFSVTSGDHIYNFRLTTLPAGERAIVQDLNRASFVAGEAIMTADVELCVFFNEEPSLHDDVFAISGTVNGIELRNLTDKEIPGPIYIYYKTRTAEGYAGGITYRISIPGLAAKGIYTASVNHFWPGSSQVMFIEYVQ